MRKKQPQWDEWQVNHILNITIVDEHLNKNRIRAKSPSVYLETFVDENEKIVDSLNSHLIDLNNDGVLDDDYGKFFHARAERISKILSEKIIKQKGEVDKDLENMKSIQKKN